MKRWPLRILLFLLLGAIVNVAVAWGCAIVLEFRGQGHVGATTVPVNGARVDGYVEGLLVPGGGCHFAPSPFMYPAMMCSTSAIVIPA